MKKILKYLLCVLVVVLLLITGIYLSAGFWITNAVSALVPQMTKTTASLERADVSLFSGKLSFHGFKIGNPEGFSKNNAFEVDEVSVHFKPMSVFSEKIIIDDIKVSGTKINAELNHTGNANLLVINANVQRYLGNTTDEGAFPTPNVPQPKEQTEETRKAVVVRDLQVIDSKLDFAVLNKKTSVSLPNIYQKNIGEKTTTTLPDLISDILTELTASSMQLIVKAGRESLNSIFGFLAEKTKDSPQMNNFVKQLPSMF